MSDIFTEEDQAEYDRYLRKFCSSFEEAIEIIDPGLNYLFLFIRNKEKEGCIDMAGNIGPEEMIHCLEEAIRGIKAQTHN